MKVSLRSKCKHHSHHSPQHTRDANSRRYPKLFSCSYSRGRNDMVPEWVPAKPSASDPKFAMHDSSEPTNATPTSRENPQRVKWKARCWTTLKSEDTHLARKAYARAKFRSLPNGWWGRVASDIARRSGAEHAWPEASSSAQWATKTGAAHDAARRAIAR